MHDGQGEMLSDYTYMELEKACAKLAAVVARVRDGAARKKWQTEVFDAIPNTCLFGERKNEGTNVCFHNILPFLDLPHVENIL